MRPRWRTVRATPSRLARWPAAQARRRCPRGRRSAIPDQPRRCPKHPRPFRHRRVTGARGSLSPRASRANRSVPATVTAREPQPARALRAVAPHDDAEAGGDGHAVQAVAPVRPWHPLRRTRRGPTAPDPTPARVQDARPPLGHPGTGAPQPGSRAARPRCRSRPRPLSWPLPRGRSPPMVPRFNVRVEIGVAGRSVAT